MTQSTPKKEVNNELAAIEAKLRKMLEELPIDEDEDEHASCGHGCSHQHR